MIHRITAAEILTSMLAMAMLLNCQTFGCSNPWKLGNNYRRNIYLI